MTTVEQTVPVDIDKLMGFVFRAVDEVGATLNCALVVMGDKLGLYKAMADAGPLTPNELASRTGTAERYVREWLNAQAAGDYVAYDPDSARYSLKPEQAIALTDESSARLPTRLLPDRPRIGARLAPRSPRSPAPAMVSAGTSTSMTSTRAASVSSGRATTLISSPSGSLLCKVSWRKWRRAPRSPTSVAGTEPRPS